MAPRICYGCKLHVYDTCAFNVNEQIWHSTCIKCHECQTILRDKCYAKETKLLCKADYYRLYGIRCCGCKQGISPDQYVRKQATKIFHLSCLKCYLCNKEASTGEQMFLTQQGFYLCRKDYEQSRPIKRSEKEEKVSEQESSDIDEKSPSSLSVNGDVIGSDDEDDINKRRGPRTTIKAKQLEVLKSAFLATPKPSRNIREKLAQDTGLSMRVIQVWFQNRRSKERRVKQLSVQDARRAMRRNKLENNGNGMAEMDFRFYQNGSSNPIMHHAYTKVDQSQYNDYLPTNQNNPLQYQPIVQEDLMLTNDFMNDPNNNELSLIDSLNHTDINRNDLCQSLLPTYENL